jgi:hypothetical protein
LWFFWGEFGVATLRVWWAFLPLDSVFLGTWGRGEWVMCLGTTHECIIHWKSVMTHLWMNHNWGPLYTKAEAEGRQWTMKFSNH